MTSLDMYLEDRPRWRERQFYTRRPKLEIVRRGQEALTPEAASDYLSGPLLRKLNKELPSQSKRRFAVHFEKLDALATDARLSYGCTEAPSKLTLARARAVLHQLETEALEPTRVVCSVEGGVAFCFVSGDKYADIECLNTEEILGVISNRRDRPTVWEIEPSASGFARAAARIRHFLNGAPGSYDAERETR